MVFDFEKNLEKIYPNLTLQKAYEQYLKDLIDPKNKKMGLIDLGNHILIAGVVLIGIFIITNA